MQNLSGGGCVPLVGAYVDIWHCDAKGIYSDEPTYHPVLAQPAYSRSTSRDTTNASDMVYRVANNERMLAATPGDLAGGYTATLTAGVTLKRSRPRRLQPSPWAA